MRTDTGKAKGKQGVESIVFGAKVVPVPSDACAAVRDTFLSLQGQIALLELACTDKNQKVLLDAQYELARTQNDQCTDTALHAGDKKIADLTQQVKAANEQVKTAAKEMGDMNKVIDAVTEAVGLGQKLIGLL
jgi:chromosome segregation ATPase